MKTSEKNNYIPQPLKSEKLDLDRSIYCKSLLIIISKFAATLLPVEQNLPSLGKMKNKRRTTSETVKFMFHSLEGYYYFHTYSYADRLVT